jgi:SOS-response transcriptional repressor LexA
MDIKQIRLRNLRILIGEAGTIANLARLSNTAPAYLSQILNSLPTSTGRPRSVGDKLARKLELAMNKPYGWMDRGNEDLPDMTSCTGDVVNYVPLINESMACRYESNLDNSQYESSERIPVPIPVGSRSFAIRVLADSMEPKFLNGDIIVIDPDIEPKPLDFVLVLDQTSNHISFKQLIEDGKQRFLRPLNPRYPLVELQACHRMIGKVVYRGEIL